MKVSVFLLLTFVSCWRSSWSAAAAMEHGDVGISVHFGFHTENGHYRSEDIKYNQTTRHSKTDTGTKEFQPVEYRGGYSFISADGYEYTVKYRADENGFQPRVTAKKITNDSKALVEKQ